MQIFNVHLTTQYINSRAKTQLNYVLMCTTGIGCQMPTSDDVQYGDHDGLFEKDGAWYLSLHDEITLVFYGVWNVDIQCMEEEHLSATGRWNIDIHTGKLMEWLSFFNNCKSNRGVLREIEHDWKWFYANGCSVIETILDINSTYYSLGLFVTLHIMFSSFTCACKQE